MAVNFLRPAQAWLQLIRRPGLVDKALWSTTETPSPNGSGVVLFQAPRLAGRCMLLPTPDPSSSDGSLG